MKSICIKTNNTNTLNYLLNSVNCIKSNNIRISQKKFKHYKNIIIHYTGNEVSSFISSVSDLLSFVVIENYEEIIIKRLISLNYFYFDSQERETVFKICLELLFDESEISINCRQEILSDIFYNYLGNCKSIILDGFINFRLRKYLEYLNPILDTAVNQFIIEREYWEFISLLKLYINSESSSAECVHLLYNSKQSILLDENKCIINFNEDIFKAKYLSDISFSANDYILNTLINILPKKIYIHLFEINKDEFINTLELIFENRITLCNNCSLCKNYKPILNNTIQY